MCKMGITDSMIAVLSHRIIQDYSIAIPEEYDALSKRRLPIAIYPDNMLLGLIKRVQFACN